MTHPRTRRRHARLERESRSLLHYLVWRVLYQTVRSFTR